MKRVLFVSLTVLAVLGVVQFASAGIIAIANNSFEEGQAEAFDIPQWGEVESYASGAMQGGPNADNYFPNGGVAGNYFATVDAGCQAYQDISSTYVAGETYTLTVATGRRKDHDELGWPTTTWGIDPVEPTTRPT